MGENQSQAERRLIDDVQSTSLQAMADVLEGVHRLKTLTNGLAARARGGNPTGLASDGTASPPSLSPTIADLLFRFSRFELDTLMSLMSIARDGSSVVFDRLRGVIAPPAGRGLRPLVFEVAPETKRTRTFVVTNEVSPEGTKAALDLALSDLREGSTGRALFVPAALFWFKKDVETLGRGEDAVVQMTVSASEPLRRGETYCGNVDVTLDRNRVMSIPIEVRVASPKP